MYVALSKRCLSDYLDTTHEFVTLQKAKAFAASSLLFGKQPTDNRRFA
jgi:hypothetical protein